MVEQDPARIVQPVEVREQTCKISDRDIRPRRVAGKVVAEAAKHHDSNIA